MHAGKPQKQAVAIAYSVKRRAGKGGGGNYSDGAIRMALKARGN